MDDKIYISAPFAKVIKKEDGGREVWGFATLERKDKSGEIADFDGTVKAFEKWSNEVEKRTGGKNKGNVRVMHQPVVAGKTIHWEPTETEIENEDGGIEKVKAIWVGAYVPATKSDVVKDIDEGILNGFSIGGKYQKRWWDDKSQAFRYVPELSEYSLVDNPCVPGADIVNVISKTAPWTNNNGGEQSVLKKEVEGSYEDLREYLHEALRNQIPYFDGYILATFPDKVIIHDWNRDKYFEASYTYTSNGAEGKEVKIGNMIEVEHVESFVPVESLKVAKAAKMERDKAKEVESPMSEKDKETKSNEDKTDDGKISKDDMESAAKAAGISMEQLTSFFKAYEGIRVKDVKPEDIDVTTVDGDGDNDNNMEFPNTPPKEDSEYIDIDAGIDSVKQAEKSDVEVELRKSGKAVSKSNMVHLKHAIGHVEAVMKGLDYGPEHHLVVENDTIDDGPNSGEESPNVAEKCYSKFFDTKELQKAVTTELSKSVNKIESLVKGLATADSLTKMVDRMDAIEKMVKEIHETPQSSGVVLNGGSQDVARILKNAPADTDNSETVSKFVQNIKDPNLRARVGEEIAIQMAKNILR